MADRIERHSIVSPRERLRTAAVDEGYFYPGEARALLDLPGIDYAQLRNLYRLVRVQGGRQVESGWARYSLRDLAGIEIAVTLAGGRDALAAGRRLQIAPVRAAVMRLRELGFTDPLLQVELRRDRGAVLAVHDGQVFNPVTGQAVLLSVRARTTQYVRRDSAETELRAAFRQECKRRGLQPGTTLRGQFPIPEIELLMDS